MLPPLPPPLARLALLFLAVAALLSLTVRADAAAPDAPAAADSPLSPAQETGIPPGGRAWSWPVPAPRVIERGYEPPADRYGPGHRGIDLAAAPGVAVTAPADGIVSFVGTVVDRPVLSIDAGNGVVASLEPVAASVHAGDRLTAGQPVGVIAAGGHCAGSCLHLGARIDGDYVNPLLFLGLAPRAVLLPLGR